METTQPPLIFEALDRILEGGDKPEVVRLLDQRVIPWTQVTVGLIYEQFDQVDLQLLAMRTALDVVDEYMGEIRPFLDEDLPVAQQTSRLPAHLQDVWPKVWEALLVCQQTRQWMRDAGIPDPDEEDNA